MRITFVIPDLFAGGAQRVMVNMANYWARREWEVTILALAGGGAAPFFVLDSRVRYVSLSISGVSRHLLIGFWNNIRRIRVLRKAIQRSRPDSVISFIDQTNVLTVLATRGLRFTVVVSERIDPTMCSMGKLWGQLRWWTYSMADCIVVQSLGACAYFLPEFEGRVVVIPNAVMVPPEGQVPDKPLALGRSIVAVGRLVASKRFDLLFKAFATLKDQYPEWTVTVLGDGPMRAELESLCAQLGLVGRVSFTGFVTDPYQHLRQASLFVLSSDYEGFPNALCEAMACGLPVIATDSSGGIREIIRNGENGLLVPPGDEKALAAAMARLMGDTVECQRLASRAVEVSQRFSVEKVMSLWEAVLCGYKRKQVT